MDMHTAPIGEALTFELDNYSKSLIVLDSFLLNASQSDKSGFALSCIFKLRL